jgi:alpha-beta hydrolase superfamily lysophospholipase
MNETSSPLTLVVPRPAWEERLFVASDGYEFGYRSYLPSGRARGHIVGLHGIQSHAGWYEYSCRHLAAAGWEVSFLDRRGSGVNQEARGDTPGFRRLLDDIGEFLISTALAGPRRPTVLLGISWGGKLAVGLQKRHPDLVDALALLCPGFCPQVRMPFSERVVIFLTRLFRPRKLFPIPLSEPELFTANPHWLEFLGHDPLALHQATARLLAHSTRLDIYLRLARRYVKVPVLLMLGGQDRIIDNETTRRFVQRFPTESVQIREYPDAHHTLEFEPDPSVFLGELVAWLADLRCGAVNDAPQGLEGS